MTKSVESLSEHREDLDRTNATDDENVVSYQSESRDGRCTSEENDKNLPRVSSSKKRYSSSSNPNEEGASYNRSYNLAAMKHKNHPDSVQRSDRSSSNSRAWNSNRKVDELPKEELPRIEITKKNKYTYLSEGKSVSSSKKHKDFYHLENDDDELRWLREASDHMSEKTYLSEIRKKLDEIDFVDALLHCMEDGPQCERCKSSRSLFKVFSKNKELITPEDLHELLLVFTPPGVALQEATDFLWEECDQKCSLNFVDFLRYGDVLRLRLHDYEMFAALSDEQKLLVTSARVFPGLPTNNPEKARVRLMMANRQQTDGQSSPEVRPLRIYEHLFLDNFQRKLYRQGLVARPESKNTKRHGDVSSEMPYRKANNAKQDSEEEDISWGDADRPVNSRHQRDTADGQESDYPALANCNKTNPKAQQRVLKGKVMTQQGQKPVALGTRPGNIPFAKRQKAPFNLDLQSRPSTDKYIGRILEDEYEDRKAADDYLLRRIQENFMYA